MSIFNSLVRRPWLLIGFCIGLSGGVQAGAMGGSDSISSQERTGSSTDPSQGTSGGSMGSSGSSMGTTGSGSSQEGYGTSQGTTGSSQGVTGSPEGSSGTSRSTYPGSTSGSSQGSGTSGGASGMQQGDPGSMGSSQGMGKIQPFQSVDKNSDSYVTKSELMDSPSLLEHFDRADANKDGQLEENEYKNLIMQKGQ